jgi:hypothetical protein
MKNLSFGEIVESSLASWKVHCWQWDTIPPFGALLVTAQANMTLFAIVASVQTGSIDPGRYPFPYQKTEEELKREQPQIFALLQTHVSCITLGYKEGGTLYYQLPPYPPKIHAFVRQANPEEMRAFFKETLYVHLLNNSGYSSSLDELLLALFKQLADHSLLTQDYLENFITMLSITTGNDYRKFKLFLQRIEKLMVLTDL